MGHRPVPDVPGQHGLLTRAQLYAAGWSRSALGHAVRTSWTEPAPSVYQPHRGDLPSEAVRAAAALWAGPVALLTGWAALEVYGLECPTRTARLTLLVPPSTRGRACDVAVVVRTRRPAVATHRRGCVPVVSPARAVVDHVVTEIRGASARIERDVRATVLAALQRKVTVPELLESELTRARVGPAGVAWRALADFRQGAWSVPEVTLRELLHPVPGVEHVVYSKGLTTPDGRSVGIPDAYCAELGLAVQVHSRQFHTGQDDEGRDLLAETFHADLRLQRAGIVVVPVTPTTLEREPQRFLAELDDAVRRCRLRPVPLIRCE